MGSRFSRREFIQTSAVAGAALVLGGSRITMAAVRPSLVKISGPGVPAAINAALKKLLEPLGGMSAFVKKGQKVMLKPNMGFPTPPEQRATTSPQLVAAVAKQVLECGASRVLIVDNPLRRPEACMQAIGIREAVSGLSVNLLMPTNDKFYVMTKIPRGKALHSLQVFRDALEVDVHIALPIAKSHMATGFSGGLKGMMGLVLDRESFHSRYEINQAIADLNTVLRAHLTILDGLQVMATDGPAGPGELIRCDTLVAGCDPVAVDAAGVGLAPLYGRTIKPKQVRHLLCAEEMGLGQLAPPPELVQSLSL